MKAPTGKLAFAYRTISTLEAERDQLRAEIEALRADAERLREALEEIRSRSSINLAMQSDPFELTARLGDIYQIADAAIDASLAKVGDA